MRPTPVFAHECAVGRSQVVRHGDKWKRRWIWTLPRRVRRPTAYSFDIEQAAGANRHRTELKEIIRR